MAEKMELRKSLRRKFSGNIRSPVVRRDSQAEVVLKGWLYKLEGATIKQWKKRWCILSEYCLFYYKGPEEEKCLGSILLPSYKIRPCTADDKVSLKHSFVAEHQNTKTYYFAAENNASMCQWMNAMSLAALMQKDTERSRQALPLHGMQAAANASPGMPPDYHFSPHVAPQRPVTQQPQRPSDESFEVEAYSAGATADGHYLGSGDQYPCSYTRSPIYDQRPPPAAPRQRPGYPVYANAPPKPLRHGATSPNVAEGGGYDACNSYEGYDFYGAQEPLPAYAGRPVSAHYGDNVPNSTMTSTQLMRPRSADFLERDDDGEDRELYLRKKSAPAVAAKPRPKSSMAHYDWENEDEAHDWRVQQQQHQQWRSRTMETVAQAGVLHDESQLGRMPSGKASSACGSSAQSKKAVHKEQSMKRLLEWKQRMLQSPLCKKQGQQQQQQQHHQQQRVVPSPQELQSAVLRKTPVPECAPPPERPPLPEEYRRRASEGSRPMDGMMGAHFNTEPRGEPVGRAQETSAPLGPDLIQHAKMSPTRYRDSPDYVNLRNLRCDPEFYHEKQPQIYTPPNVQSQKPLRSCLSQSSGDRRHLPSQHEQPGTDRSKPLSKTDQNSTHYRDETSPYNVHQDSQNTSQLSRAFSPFEKTYSNEAHNRSYNEAREKPCTEDNRPSFYDTAYVHSDRQLSPTNILVQRGNQNATAGSHINREKKVQQLNESFSEARQTSYSSPGSSLPRHQNDESSFLEEKSLLQGRPLRSPHGSAVIRDPKSVLRHHNTRLSSSDRATNQDSNLSRSDQGLSSPRPNVPQERLYGNADMWLRKDSPSPSRPPQHPKNASQDEESFLIKKEDYYRASQMFYPKQPASKTLLGSVSDIESSGSGAAEMESFDSRYRRSSTTPKSPQWEIDKDVGLPVPDNLDVSFQSTSNNSVFEASCEGQTPGDQSPELFQGTLRPNRTYVRDRQLTKSPMHLPKDVGIDTEVKCVDATEVKTPVGSSSFEEMRAAYQKKKEAPPVNIVQDRIKCFEPKDETSPRHGESVRESWEAAEEGRIGERAASSVVGNNIAPQDVEFRTSASDAAKIDSLSKYGSTSILASLHRSAEFNRESAQHARGDYFRQQEQAQKPDTVSLPRHCPQEPPPCAVQSKPPEAHYLPMGWLTSEADYVSMNVDLSPGCPYDEPVYNEPVLPVTSYAHDSYGKSSLACQILKSESSGSSSGGSVENIYEQVQQTSEDLNSMPYSNTGNNVQSKRESPPVYEEPYRLAPSQPEGKSPEKPKSHEMYMKDGYKHLVRKAIPDLLHHEEVKDSGASDADDEASRADFDTATSSLPSYQKEILNDHVPSPLRSPAQPYLPVYTSHATKYSFKKERKPDDATSSSQGTDAFKELEKRSPSQHSKFVSFAGTAPLTNSKINPDAFVKVSSYQSENRPTSIGLLKSLDGETSSSEAGSSLTSSVVKTSSADASLRGSSNQGDFSQVSSPLLSTAPDVLPSEVRCVVSESNSNKVLNSSSSGNSAPYYYSDIFGGKLGSAFGSSAARPASQQSRTTPNMLNNTRDVTSMSPHSKDLVGRKVNKISTPQAGLSVSHTRTLSEPQSTADLESTLRGLLHPANTRKFSDAERNKYVAGHTLEKTSHMSRSVLCHMRSKQAAETSQPRSKDCIPASCGDSEEGTRSRSPGRMLPRRLSRSLEDIIDNSPGEHVTRSKTPLIPSSCQDEPYYENVGFGSARVQPSPSKTLSGASPQVSPAKHSIYDGEDLCREFVASSVMNDPLGILGKSAEQLPAEKPQKTAACSGDFVQMGSLSCSLGSLKLSSPERQEVPLYSSRSPMVETGKRCWSNGFQKSAAQSDLHRHSIDNLHGHGTEVQSKNSPERASQPTSPSSQSLSHSISAGDLLGKSHEELVLLLIQLRRSQSNLSSCQLQCKEELHELKQKLVQSGTQNSAADVQRLVGLQRSLNELTRNLDLTQPLISLVENMVKLGSLYTVAGITKQKKKMDEGEDYRYEDTYADTLEAETLEKQQLLIEKEILHIQNMLAESTSCGSPLKDDLEVELKRLQKIVNDLLQRRSKVSMPPDTYVEKEPQVKAKPPEPRHSPTAGVPERKRHQKTYYETDLDSSVTSNLALDSRPTSLCDIVTTSQIAELESPSFSPEPNEVPEDRSSYGVQDISKADDRTKKFYGLLPRDRAQEIKTVRIVKRESERRNKVKDRRRGGLDDSCPWLAEEGDSVFQNEEEEESVAARTPDTTVSMFESSYETKKPAQDSTSSEDRSASSSSSESMASGQRTPFKNESRRNKRRHYTISGSHPFLEQHSPPKMPTGLRSRDDMDMERCLRTVNTPDIVRSTIKKSEVFDEQTIDMQIGLPQKILIPERYIEVESENVSAVEQLRRSLKAANIRKMLTETVGPGRYEDLGARGSVEVLRSKVGEEKRRRAHLLALSHTIAKEVMERSKMVAAHVTYQENT
ncbi:uncharacterized protein LOC119169614 isoform X4 [Rhipicephalus microplus]|uniref:uncharacterized protein LOC119169614 isoform X4 n=1 Tax=Rhipicephalus microplus TaxID=6941 RepID=UPI003F6CFF27